MISRRLREDLEKDLGIGSRGLYKKAEKLKVQHVLSRTEHAIYLIAIERGFDLSKYVDGDIVERVRQLRQQVSSPTPSVVVSRGRKGSHTKITRVVIGREIELEDPLLPPRTLQDAKAMAQNVYPLLYVFENSIRELISRVLKGACGGDWWDAVVPDEIKKKVQERKDNEVRQPWHGRRGVHEIFYTDLKHLKRIVTSNWSHFENILPNQGWLGQKLDEIELSRNIVAHCNPVRERDVNRLKVYLGDWQQQVENVRALIP